MVIVLLHCSSVTEYCPRLLYWDIFEVFTCSADFFFLSLLEWERYPNRFRNLYETLLSENLGNHCRQWSAGKPESEVKLLNQENIKPQDLIVYTDGSVTKDQSGWGFTVKQGATTIHEDSAAYTVSTSSLTMEVEAVIHALCWIASRGDSQTTHAIILIDSMSLLQKVKNGMG